MTYLITALSHDGMRPPRTFRWRENSASCVHAGEALLRLLPEEDRPTTIVAVLTEEAERQTWAPFQASVQGHDREVRVQACHVADVQDEQGLFRAAQELASGLPAEGRLVVDVTHGFRHISMLMLFATLFARTLRRLDIRHVFYGMDVTAARPATVMIDVQPILGLAQWTHALQAFRSHGHAGPLGALIREALGKAMRAAGEHDSKASQAAGAWEALDLAYHDGLPWELGKEARRARSLMGDALIQDAMRQAVPLSGEIMQHLGDHLERLAMPRPSRGKGRRADKGGSTFDPAMQARQAHLISRFLSEGRTGRALGLLTEWLVSSALLDLGRGTAWLEYEARQEVTNALNGRLEPTRSPADGPGILLSWQQAWTRARDDRNQLLHHGMRKDVVRSRDILDRTREAWSDIWDPAMSGRQLCLPPFPEVSAPGGPDGAP